MTATLADGDGPVSNLTWQWARGSTATGTFDNITGATSDRYTPVATDVAHYLKSRLPTPTRCLGARPSAP